MLANKVEKLETKIAALEERVAAQDKTEDEYIGDLMAAQATADREHAARIASDGREADLKALEEHATFEHLDLAEQLLVRESEVTQLERKLAASEQQAKVWHDKYWDRVDRLGQDNFDNSFLPNTAWRGGESG